MSVLFNIQSCYSLLSSSLKISDIIQFAKTYQYQAIGICENDNLFSAMSFYRQAIANGIQPIIGINVKVNIHQKKYGYLIIAKDNQGYLSLIKLSSQLVGKNQALEFTDLQNIDEHCFVVNQPEDNYVYDGLLKDQNMDDYFAFLMSHDHWFLAVGSNFSQYHQKCNEKLLQRFPFVQKKIIAADNGRFLSLDQYEATKALIAMKENKKIDDSSLHLSLQCDLKTPEQLTQLYAPIALENTDRLAQQVHLELEKITSQLPEYPLDKGTNSKQYLSQLAFTGLAYRLNHHIPTYYQKRLDYELKVICEMGYQDYFLIVYDIIKTARKRNIQVGPGRGSAVGCLVAYCLGITHIDPVKNGLFFERFLNPERISLPDIDIDIPDDKRLEIISCIKEKYGNDHVCQIIAFDTLKSKAVIHDVAKVLNLTEYEIHLLTSKITQSDQSLAMIYQQNLLFQQAIMANEKLQRLYRICLVLEGLPKAVTTHAAGIVISKKPLLEVIPLYPVSNGWMTQFSKDYLEQIGLIKFDLLALRNLTLIDAINRHISPTFDIMKVPLDDVSTYQLLQQGLTKGIFQLETAVATNTLLKVCPTKFDDIVVTTALIRPGAKNSIPTYLENKKNPDQIHYLNLEVKKILQETNGIILYQEQIMQLAVVIAGFSLGKADILRKAISKKNGKEITQLQQDFIENGLRNGYQQKHLEQIYQQIDQFGQYGFNKSHAMAYGLISYQLAYLKAHYPIYFYCECLNQNLKNTENCQQLIIEMRQKKIGLLPVDLNHSSTRFTTEQNHIRFPLTAINYLPLTTVQKIINYRQEHGPIQDLFAFYFMVKQLKCNDQEVQALVKAGSLDYLGFSKTTILQNKQIIMDFLSIGTIYQQEQEMIDYQSAYMPMITPYVDQKGQSLIDQMEYLGLYLNGHPTESYFDQYPKALHSNQLKEAYGSLELIGLVTSIKKIKTRKQQNMAFIQITDEYGAIELSLLPKWYDQYIGKVKKNDIVYVKVRKKQPQANVTQYDDRWLIIDYLEKVG